MTHARLTISAALLVAVGAGTAASLIGAASHSSMNDLAAPALLIAGLLAFGLGSLVFAPGRGRRRS